MRGCWKLSNGARLEILANLGEEEIPANLPAGETLFQSGDPRTGAGCVAGLGAA